MAIKKDTLKALLKLLKFSDDDITKAVDTDEEVAIEAPKDLKIWTAAEWDGNNEKDDNGNYKNPGVKRKLQEEVKNTYIGAGTEIAVKQLKEKAGLNFDGKDMDKFLSEYKAHVLNEANVKPNEAKAAWETEKAAMQQSIADLTKQVNDSKSESAAAKRDQQWLSKFPKANDLMSNEDRLYLLKRKLEEKEDGLYYNGKKLQDEQFNNLSLDQALDHVFKAEKWDASVAGTTPPTGPGFGDTTSADGIFKNITQFNEHLTKKGIEVGSEESNKLLAEAVQKNPTMLEQA